MTEQTISCEEAIRLIASYIDRELDSHDSEQIEKHVRRCKSCMSRVEFEQRLKTQLATLRSEQVSEQLNDRIRGLLQHFGTE